MILFHGSYACTLCDHLARKLNLGIGFVPPAERTHTAMLRRVASQTERGRFVDFQWHRDSSRDPGWIADAYGTRSSLRSSTKDRSAFFSRVAREFPDGPIVAMSGNVNDGRRSREYAREAVRLRDAQYSDRRVVASFVLDRQGLADNSVVAGLSPLPRGVEGIALSVQDVAFYPSVWAYEDWYAWLRLIRGFVDEEYEVVLPYSDVRGLVALGVGAREYGTGPQQSLRQLRPAKPTKKNDGARAPVSYVSIPLLSILHGSRAALESDWDRIESHSESSRALGPMAGLHATGSSFDEVWTALGQPRGEVTDSRIAQHINALVAAEDAIVAGSPADMVEAQLEESVRLSGNISKDVFKNSGGLAELDARLRAFRSVRQELAF